MQMNTHSFGHAGTHMHTWKSCHPTHRPHMATCVYNCSAESYYIDQCDRPIIQVLVDLRSWDCVQCTRVHAYTQLDEDIVWSLIIKRSNLAFLACRRNYSGYEWAQLCVLFSERYFWHELWTKQLRDTETDARTIDPAENQHLLCSSSQLSVHCSHLPLCVLADAIPLCTVNHEHRWCAAFTNLNVKRRLRLTFNTTHSAYIWHVARQRLQCEAKFIWHMDWMKTAYI